MSKTVAIIAAAGQGKRMKNRTNKQFLQLLDKPVLAHTLYVFQTHPLIDEILVITKTDEINYCYNNIVNYYNFTKVKNILAGGQERQDSVFQGLQNLPKDCDLVVVHDGARPLISQLLISKIIQDASSLGASLAAVPVKNTIKKVDNNNNVIETLDRATLWAVQTPQAFKKDIILKAYEEAYKVGFYGTDDASLVEKLGYKVKVVLGEYENIKITTPEDLEIATSILRRKK